MARLQTTGTISVDDVRNTFSLTGATALGSLYKGGGIVPNTPQHAGVPTSGTINLSDLYGADVLAYTMTPAATTLDEGGANDGADPSTQTFSVSATGFSADTTGTLYWTLDATTDDFDAVSGSFAFDNNSGTFDINVKTDNLTEGTENFTVSLREDSISGTVVATSTVEVLDTSIAASYGLTGPSAINEGATGTFNITAGGVADGTTVYWTIDSATTADFTAVSGSASITSNAASFSIAPLADTLTEGAETYTVSIRSGSVSGSVLASVNNVVINDTSISAPTYSLTGAATIAEDGANNTYTVTTTDVADGTTLYWTLNGTTADFNAVSGSFSVTSNSGTFNVVAKADAFTEGTENFVISVRETSVSGTVVDTLNISVTDDSQTPAPTYAMSVGSSTVDEGDAATFTVTTTNVADGTTLYWSADGLPASDTAAGADFDPSTAPNFPQGTVTINSNTGTWSVTLAADSLTEGTQRFRGRLFDDAARTNEIVSEIIVTINDTSTTPTSVTGSINTDGATSINEGDTITLNIFNTGNVTHTFTWELVDTNGDFNTPTTGTITLAAGADGSASTGSAIEDLTTEGNETFTIRLKDDQGSLLDSTTITLNDTSTTPAPTYAIVTPASVNEGATASITINTTSVANGTVLYWAVGDGYYGDITNDDFDNPGVNNYVEGSVTINSNTGTFGVAVTADNFTEGAESFSVFLYDDAARTNSVADTLGVNDVEINDTSTTAASPVINSVTGPASVNEGSTATINVVTSDIADGTTMNWSIATNASDFGTTSGTFTVSSDAGSFTVTPTADTTTEGAETFTVTVSGGSATAVTSSAITINDTSTTPLAPTINSVTGPASVNEGSAATINVSTTDIADGTTMSWSIASNAGDFATSSGTFSISGNSGSFTVTPTEDTTTEGAETFTVTVSGGSATSVTSSAITINDTSVTAAAVISLGTSATAQAQTSSTSSSSSALSKITFTVRSDGTLQMYAEENAALYQPGWTVNGSAPTNGGDFEARMSTWSVDNNVWTNGPTIPSAWVDLGSGDLSLNIRHTNNTAGTTTTRTGDATIEIREKANTSNVSSQTYNMTFSSTVPSASGGGFCFVAGTPVMVINPDYDGK